MTTPDPPPQRPLIVIPARFSASVSALRFAAEVNATKLVGAVWAAGGEPLTVHPPPSAAPMSEEPMSEQMAGVAVDTVAASLTARFTWVDGVLLPGGGDLSPRWSGQTGHSSLYDVDETQDVFDLALARWALAQRVPLLSVCRGTQVVNVARGGTLVQDMNSRIGGAHRPRVHDVVLDAASPLNATVAGDRLQISCSHHQCLDRLGRGLVPAAHADDGTIEAVTLEGHDGWFLGVQWHPEDTTDTDPVQARIFATFVDAARRGNVAGFTPDRLERSQTDRIGNLG